MLRGYIKQWRKIKEWEWYKTPHMVHFFGHLIREANHKEGRWQGIVVQRGQLICGRKKLALETGLSEQVVRTCIERLKSTSEITIKATNRFSVITILRYEDYQPEKKEATSEPTNDSTNKQPTSNQQATTNNNGNNANNVEEGFSGEKNEKLRRPIAEIESSFYDVAVEQGWCDRPYIDKTLPQAAALTKEHRTEYERKIRVAFNSWHSTGEQTKKLAKKMFHEIAGHINDFGDMQRMHNTLSNTSPNSQ